MNLTTKEIKGQNVAYVRVSTIEQNEQRQIEALEKYDIDAWYIEKVSAKDMNRPQLQEMLRYVRKGDTVYILDFSRLARSIIDLLKIVNLLEQKEVKLVSLKENIDTSTPTGRLMLTMVGAISQFERENTLERQREGIAIAKSKGKYRGRKKITYPENWKEVYNKWKKRELKGVEAMQLLNLKRCTFYKLVHEYEETHQLNNSN